MANLCFAPVSQLRGVWFHLSFGQISSVQGQHKKFQECTFPGLAQTAFAESGDHWDICADYPQHCASSAMLEYVVCTTVNGRNFGSRNTSLIFLLNFA